MKQYTFEELKAIIQMLRSENGCPWDREQTHESLRPCVTEEAAELVAAIRIYGQTGNAENMEEELGDLLLQVLMHSEIAAEEHLFTIDDVIQTISEKMVRRHPHVFGNVSVENSGQVLANWEEIKKTEKEGKSWIESPLREIPRELPALVRATKVLKKVDKLYEPGRDYYEAVAGLRELADRLTEINPSEKQDELEQCIGEILMDISDISRICKISQEQILSDKIEDMIERFEPIR